MKAYKRIISLLQTEYFMHNLGVFYSDEKELEEENNIDSFVKYVIDNKNNSLADRMSTLLSRDHELAILYMRTVSDTDIEKFIRDNFSQIKGNDVSSLYDYNEIIHITTPNDEELIFEVGGHVFEDDLPNASLPGYGFLVDKDLNILKGLTHYNLNYSMCKVRPANSKEKRLFNSVNTFNQIDREYGEFAKDDMIYLVDEERFDFVNDRDTDKLLEGMLDNKVHLVFNNGSLEYCVSEYGLQIPDIDFLDEW